IGGEDHLYPGMRCCRDENAVRAWDHATGCRDHRLISRKPRLDGGSDPSGRFHRVLSVGSTGGCVHSGTTDEGLRQGPNPRDELFRFDERWRELMAAPSLLLGAQPPPPGAANHTSGWRILFWPLLTSSRLPAASVQSPGPRLSFAGSAPRWPAS